MNGIGKRSVGTRIGKIGTGIIVALLSLSAMAESVNPNAYNMIVIEDQALGRAIESGQYEEAIDKMARRGLTDSKRFNVNNNLCVAYLMSRKFKAAKGHCDLAVASQSKGLNLRNSSYYLEMDMDRAIALSNRGVLRALTGDYEGARSDLEVAVNLDTGLKHPVINLAKFESKMLETNAALPSQ